jgi:hypothetical protein
MKSRNAPIDFLPRRIAAQLDLEGAVRRIGRAGDEVADFELLRPDLQRLRQVLGGIRSKTHGELAQQATDGLDRIQDAVSAASFRDEHWTNLKEALQHLSLPERKRNVRLWANAVYRGGEPWFTFFERIHVPEAKAIRAKYAFERVIEQIEPRDRDLLYLPAFSRARKELGKVADKAVQRLRDFFSNRVPVASLLERGSPLIQQLPKQGRITLIDLLEHYKDFGSTGLEPPTRREQKVLSELIRVLKTSNDAQKIQTATEEFRHRIGGVLPVILDRIAMLMVAAERPPLETEPRLAASLKLGRGLSGPPAVIDLS